MDEITIKRLDNTFCNAIINLVLPIQQTEFGVAVTLEGQPDLLDIETNYTKGGGGFWGAFYNGKLVGTIALIAVGNGVGILRKMFVAKELRGKQFGVGQLLLDELLVYCSKNNIADVCLGTVDVFKAAQRFYERNGFTVIEKSKLPPEFLFMPADTLFYHLHINN